MKFCYFGKDGGQESRVWGFWLIESKALFSVALLRFENGTREAFHSHAFNAVSWVLGGELRETVRMGDDSRYVRAYRPSLRWVWTPRDRMHNVVSIGRTWVLTFRGPWRDTWQEFLPAETRTITLTHGRKEV